MKYKCRCSEKMIKYINNLKLSIKVALLGAGSVFITVTALVILAVWQSGDYNVIAQNEVNQLIDADLDHITQGVYNLVRTEDEAVQYQVSSNLKVARNILAGRGNISLANDSIGWTATNQFTNRVRTIIIPKMLVGGKWIGINYNPKAQTMIVDEIAKLLGETSTIFQRINKNGDMLRVATTITTSGNKRAIGTYIPAINPDGSANPVITSILNNKTYHGRASVVNSWYLTAYEPIKDNKGNIVGMLYVGVKQKMVESRIRQAILQTKVGKTGYVYILGGKNEDRGKYIISQKGERDGENIWDNLDSDNNYVVRLIISKAVQLHKGNLATIRYRWQNPGESVPRWKVARLAYYEPWDWVIGTSVYEDELNAYHKVLGDGRKNMIAIMAAAGFIILLSMGLLGAIIAWRIARPLRQMTMAAEIVTHGNLDQVIDVNSKDEIGTLALTFNFMTSQLRQTMEGLRKSEEFLNSIIENIPTMIYVKDAEELRLVRLNKAGEEILGSSGKDLIGKNDFDIFLKDDAGISRQRDMEVIKNKHLLDSKEEKINTMSLGERIFHIKRMPLLSENGLPQYLLGIAEDITEWKKAEEEINKLNADLENRVKHRTAELEIANKDLETFAYSVSHDLRAPLRAIEGFSSFIREEYFEILDDTGKDYINRLHNSAIHMGELIDNMLLLSRVKISETKFSYFSLSELAQAIVDEFRLNEPERNVNVIIEEGISVYADLDLIRIALTNLMSNAWKYTSKCTNAEIEIGAKDIEGKKVYYVKDNGAGFDMTFVNNLFIPFKRLHSGSEFKGTGVGLATVHRIIKRHGGDIWAEAEVDKGAIFYFTLLVPGKN